MLPCLIVGQILWLLVGHISLVRGQTAFGSCSFDEGSDPKANLIFRDENSFTFTDEQDIPVFRKWGSFCCNDRASSFEAILPSTAPATTATCNHLYPNNFTQIELQISKTNVSCTRSAIAGYVICDIDIQGNLSGYFDRKKECTYSPVPVLTCQTEAGAPLRNQTLTTNNVKFLDENRAPQWSTDLTDITITEYTFSEAVNLLVDPLDSDLSVSEPTDIWGSSNWNVNLTLGHSNGIFPWSAIDYARTVYADPGLPNPIVDRTIPAIRLTRRIPYTECSSSVPPCVLTAELIATDGNGSASSTTLRVTVTDVNDLPPVFDRQYDDVVIDEDNESATEFPNVTAHDQDTGINCPMIYSIGDVPPFVIDNTTGQLGVNGDVPLWLPNGPNTFVIVVMAMEDENFDNMKCSRRMIATTNIVVRMTSPRSIPVDISTEPPIVVARKFDTSEQELTEVVVRRNGQSVSDVNFVILDGGSFRIGQKDGVLRKTEGVSIDATTAVVVGVTDAKNRSLGQIRISVTVDHPEVPQFGQPLYEANVYSEQDITLGDSISGQLENCNLTIREKDGPVPNATNGIATANWLDWVHETKRYRSVYTAVCAVPNTPLSATAELIVNWHPLPQFDLEYLSSISVKENIVIRSVVAVFSPLHDFPYPLNFELNDESGPFTIDSSGRMSVIRQLNAEEQSNYSFVVSAFEQQGNNDSVLVPIFVEVIPNVPIPAHWLGHLGPVSCNSSTGLPITAGDEELSDLTVTIVGDNENCATIIPDANGDFSLSIKNTADCGVTFSLVLFLKGKYTQETVVVDVTGCPTVIEPEFSQAVEEKIFYFDSSPAQTSPVENCSDCLCQFLDENAGNERVQLDNKSGRVTVTAIPSVLSSYSSTYTVQCTSTSSAKRAKTAIRIEWHPAPRFQNSSEISILETVTNGTVIQALHPLDDFPYQLQYNLLNSQSPFIILNGHLIFERTSDAPLQPSYDILIAVGEPGRTPVNISVKVNVISIPPPFQPARFINQTILNLPCNDTSVLVGVDSGSEKWNDIDFEVLTNRPNQTCVSFHTGTAGTLTVTPNRNGSCGEEFRAAVGLQGPNSPLNVVILEFIGCEVPIVPAPTFPDTFFTMDSYFDAVSAQSPPVRDCTDCSCNLRVVNDNQVSSHAQLDPATGILSVKTFPIESSLQDGLNYQSTFQINCASPTSSEAAVTVVQINWHPRPVIRAGPVLTTSKNATSGTILASLLPSYSFPYPVTYSLERPELPFAVDSNANLIINGVLDSSEYNLQIVAGEPNHPTSLTIEIIVEPVSNDTVFHPAKFTAQMLTVPCNGISAPLPVYLGGEVWNELNFSAAGANSHCFTVHRTETVGAVTVTATAEVNCGENFLAAVSLQGQNGASADIIVLHFMGCSVPPEPPAPTFSQSLYTTHWYNASTSGQSTPTVDACSDCACTMSSVNPSETVTFAALDAQTGSINITHFPEPLDKYLSTLEVRCVSRSSNKEATMIIQIYWHPMPEFPKFNNPVAVLQNSPVDVVVALLNPVRYFPYLIEYYIQNSSSDYPFKIVDGALILKGEAFNLEQSVYTVNIRAGEPDHFIDIVVNVDVSRPLPVILPAKFAQSVFPNSSCDVDVTVQVETNGYNWADLGFEIPFNTGNCARLDPSETQIIVTPNPERNCGTEFSVAVRMFDKVTNNVLDTALVQFVGCRGPSTTTTVTTDTNTTQSTTPATTGSSDPSTTSGSTDPSSTSSTTTSSTETGETDSTITTATTESTSSDTTVTSTNQNTTSQTTRPTDETNSTDTTTAATSTSLDAGSGDMNSTISSAVTSTAVTTTRSPSSETNSTVTTTGTHMNTSDTTVTSTQSTINTTNGSTTIGSSSTNSTASILLPTDPPGQSNMLSQFSSRFSETAQKFFDFNANSKELHIKDLPDSASIFHLDFVSDRATRIDQSPRAENYVLLVRMLSGAVKTPAPAAFGTTEIILVVMGSLLLIAVIVIFVGLLKFNRQRKPKVPVDGVKPVVNGIKKDVDIELAHKTTELDRPIIVTAPPSHHGGTITSVPFLGSLREDSDSDTVKSSRGASIGSASGEFEPDHMQLVEHENLEHESTDSIRSGEVIHNPPFEYEANAEPPTTQAASEPSIKVIPDAEPEPDYPVNMAPPPPPPPPVVADIPEMKRTVSREKLLEQPRITDGENFLSELKTAVSNPYIVLKPIDNGSSSESEADKKVRFGPAVEVITSPPASPALPHDIHSPPLPAYSPMLSHSLAKNTTLIMPSPPSPAYITPLILAAQKTPALVVQSSPVPAYKSTADKRLRRQESVEKEDEIVSNRQISRDKITEPPPLPSAHVPVVDSPDDTVDRYLPSGQADDENDESRTAL